MKSLKWLKERFGRSDRRSTLPPHLRSRQGARAHFFRALRLESLEDRRVLTTIDLASLGGAGIAIYGATAGDKSGWAVTNAGDVNGDGFDDLLIGALYADAATDGKPDAGEAYLIYGGPAMPATVDLDSLGAAGVTIYGADAIDYSGVAVSGAGDVNGDGFDDLFVGASSADSVSNGRANAGESYLIYGSSALPSTIDLASLGSAGVIFFGIDSNDFSAGRVSVTGDVNGDGYDDLLIGAFFASALNNLKANAGESYLVFGGPALPVSIDLTALGTAGVTIFGATLGDASGRGVSGAGDVNGDGIGDLIIGAFFADAAGDSKSFAGDSYVIYGKSSWPATMDLGTLGTAGVTLFGADNNDNSGNIVSSAGDFNGDGFGDWLIGASRADAASNAKVDAGESYLVFGSAALPTTIDLATLGSAGVTIYGGDADDRSAQGVGSAGDVNGDGFDDLIVGSNQADAANNAKSNAGESYVIFGSASPPAAIDVGTLGGAGITMYGADADDFTGLSVSGAGDVDGDGYDDVLVAAREADAASNAKSAAGDSYLIFGANFSGVVTHPGTPLSETIVGDAFPNVIIGGQGNDLLVGSGGADVLRGGEGDDILAISDLAFARLVGGNGFDSLRLDGSGLSLDLTTIANTRVQGIEEIDITGSGNNRLTLNYSEVRNLTGEMNTVRVRGNSGDRVSFGAGWKQIPDETIGSDTFQTYTQGGNKLQVQSTISLLTKIDLTNLGAGGITIYGADSVDASGYSTSNAGDVNGDGFDDFLIGARDADAAGNAKSLAGESYVVFGGPTPATIVDLANLGSAGVIIYGADAGDYSGFSVSGAGDMNGDGFDDLLIGSHRADAAGNAKSQAGDSYIVFGGPSLPASIDLANLGAAGTTIFGADTDDRSGRTISTAGDFNSDGFADLVIGAHLADASGNGKSLAGDSYVVFGASSLPATIDLAALGSAGTTIFGAETDDQSGWSVSGAGDANGDGFDDVLISARFSDGVGNATSNGGDNYLIFGSAAPPATINLASLGSAGVIFSGANADDYSGTSVSNAGDVNGDGFDDVLIGARFADAANNLKSRAGDSYLVFGGTGLTSLNLANLGTAGVTFFGADTLDLSGASVSTAGDVNGDGFDDLVIGAYWGDGFGNGQATTGESYLIFGGPALSPVFDLGALGSTGVVIYGVDAGDELGFSVGSAGDINGDGFDDLLLGARSGAAAGNAKPNAGDSYVIFGGDFTGAVTHQGGTGPDTILADAAPNVVIGGQGNDTLLGGAGNDVLRGGSGDDTLGNFDLTFPKIVGANGFDTVRFEAGGLTLDLTAVADNRITGIEEIDITGIGRNQLILNYREVLNISDESNTLWVRRNTGDIVVRGSGWTQGFDEFIGPDRFEVYTQGAARLKVQGPRGFIITQPGGTTGVDESGTTDSFDVVLDEAPTADVVISISRNDTTEASISATSLTFTTANWNTPQTVTVTGLNENIIDGPQITTLTLSVVDASSEDAFDPVPDQTVMVTTTDNDFAGFTIVESGGSTDVAETGTTDTFTLVLTAQPATNVVLSITRNDATEASASPTPLTFTSGNWNAAQTVTITGLDDNLIDGTQNTTFTVSVVDGSSDNNFDPVLDQTVIASTSDNDVAGFTITQSGGTTSVTEAGSTDGFSVVLTAQPNSNVVLSVTSGDLGEATVDFATLTFTPGDWNTPHPVTVTGIDDSRIDGTQITNITLSVVDGSSDDNFDALSDQAVSASTTDDDTAGLVVVESGGATSVSEGGSTDSFTVRLTAQPDTDVQFSVTSDDLGEATVDTATLTFTSADWNVAQTVTVTGVDDDLIDGPQNTTVTLAIIAAASDDNFDGVPDQTVTAATTDNDSAGFTIVESDGMSSVTEAGSTDAFTIVLNAQPNSDVQISVNSADIGEATADVATVIFTSGDWNVPKTVTLTGVDDRLIDGTQNTTITLSVLPGSSDDNFDGVANQTVTVATTDDDVAGFVVVESGGTSSVAESGSTDNFTVVLSSQPDTDVQFSVSSADTGEAMVDVAFLTFTNANWDTPQSVTLTGVDDNLIDGTQNSVITISVITNTSDDNFDGLANQSVSVATTDDDAAGFAVVQTGLGTTVSESGSTDTFTVVLTAQPNSDVQFTVNSGNIAESTVDVATLTFTNANWNSPQTVTVTGVNDDRIDGPQNSLVTLAVVPAASDDNFDNLANQVVNVATTDNDVADIIIVELDGLTSVSEAGTTDTLTIRLAAQPDSDVTLGVSSGDPGEATVDMAALTFTPANWNVPQTVTITGIDDDRIDGTQTTTLTVTVVDASSDDNFDGVADKNLDVATADDDVPGFQISNGGSLSVTEAGGQDSFDVALTAQPDSDVQLTITSGNLNEVAVLTSTVTFTSTNWNVPQTISLQGVNDNRIDGTQQTTVTITVDAANSDDNFDGVASQQVDVATSDDDVAGFIINETGPTSVNETGTTDTFTVVLDAQPDSDVQLEVTSGNVDEAVVDQAILTFTPANWNTPQTVTVTGVDDNRIDGTQNTVLTVKVLPNVSDDLFDGITDQTVTVATTDDDVAGFLVMESGGGTTVAESGTTDTFTIMLDVQPDSDVEFLIDSADPGEATVNLSLVTFTPTNWNIPQTVTVQGINDDRIDGTQSYQIIIRVETNTSDDHFDGLADQTIQATTTDDDVAGFVVVQTGGTTIVSESGSTDTFTVVLTAQPDNDVTLTVANGDATEITVSAPTLTFTIGNWNVPQTVTISGVDDNRIDGSQNSVVTVAVNASLSDDAFDGLAGQAIQATTTDDDIAGFVIAQSNGSTSVGENGSTDSFTVVLTAQPGSAVMFTLGNSDPTEISISAAALTFTDLNWNVPQTVTINGVDDDLIDGLQNSIVTVAVNAALSDDSFDALLAQTVTVATTDNDAPGFIIVETDGSTIVHESGTTDTFTVVLTIQPGSDVVLSITSSDPGEATALPFALTFTASNWNTPQVVTVTGVSDTLVDGTQDSNITIQVLDSSSDDAFDAVPEQSVSFSTNDNAAPTEVSLTGNSVAENEVGADIGTVTVTDPDDAAHTLAVSDDRFEIVGSTLRLIAGQSLDFEAGASISVDITARDPSGLELTKSFTIGITNVNDAPSDLTLSASSVIENSSGAVIGTLSVTDVEAGDTHSYQLSDNRFEIVNSELKLKAGQSLDFETAQNINLDVTAQDSGGLEITRTFAIEVTDVNEIPTSIGITNLAVRENLTGEMVGDLSATDPDAGQTHTFTVTDPRFEVVGAQLKLKDDQALDLDQESSIDVEVSALDNGTPAATLKQTFVLTVAANPFPWQNPVKPLDSDNDPAHNVAPIDALVIINLLNDPGTLIDQSGRLPRTRPARSTLPYYDTDADGFAATIDVLLIINFLNASPEGEGESAAATRFANWEMPNLTGPLPRTEPPNYVAQFGRDGSTRPSDNCRPMVEDARRIGVLAAVRRSEVSQRTSLEETLAEIACDVAANWHRR